MPQISSPGLPSERHRPTDKNPNPTPARRIARLLMPLLIEAGRGASTFAPFIACPWTSGPQDDDAR
jgi:hypothetical protein